MPETTPDTQIGSDGVRYPTGTQPTEDPGGPLPPFGDASGASDGQALVYNATTGLWEPGTTSGSGVTDHGALNGKEDDDHTQYHTDARAESWLSGLTSAVTPASGDKVLLLDASDGDNPAHALFSDFGGSGGAYDIINVKTAHSAAGDDSTDDTAAIAAAVTAAGSTKLLYFPAGTYLTDPIDCSDLPGIIGDGEVSIIKLRAQNVSTLGDHGLLEVYGTIGTHKDDWIARDFVLDGNQANMSGTDSLNMECMDIKYLDRGHVQNVIAKNAISEGFDVDNSTNIVFEGCTALDCGGNGFHMSNGAEYNKLIGCTADNCGDQWSRSGFDQYDGSAPEANYNTYLGCRAVDCYRNWKIDGANAVWVANLSLGTTTAADEFTAALEASGSVSFNPMAENHVVRKTADTSRSSTTTATADPHLSIAVEANTSWAVKAVIFTEAASATPDIKVGIDAPTGASGRVGVIGPPTSATSTVADRASSTRTPGSTGNRHSEATEPITITIEGVYHIGGTAGDIEVIWAQATSNGSATTVNEDSYLQITKLGSGGSTLNDLSDVDTATNAPATGDLLKFNGTSWVPVDAPQIKVKTADQTKVSDTTLASDSTLVFTGLPDATTYVVEGMIVLASGTGADFAAQFTGDMTAAARFALRGPIDTVALNDDSGDITFDVVAQSTSFTVGGPGSANETSVLVSGSFLTDQANASFNFQWAQATSNAGDTIVSAGSWLKITPVV